jgi:hypothetical protein
MKNLNESNVLISVESINLNWGHPVLCVKINIGKKTVENNKDCVRWFFSYVYESINRTLKKCWEDNLNNMGTKCAQLRKSRKFFFAP